MNQTWIKSIALLAVYYMQGQEFVFQDNIQFEYDIAPSVGKHEIENYTFMLNKRFHFFGFRSLLELGYSRSQISYFDIQEYSSTDPIEQLHVVQTNLSLQKELSNQWKIGLNFEPQISSNLMHSLSSEDIILGYGLRITKNWNKNMLSIGFGRSTVFGQPKILPVIELQTKINSFIYVLIGFPESSVQYYSNERHRFGLHSKFEGKYYHITGLEALNSESLHSSTKLSYSRINLSFEHQYRLQPNITATTRIGYFTNNDLSIEYSNSNAQYTFQTNGSLYFSMGLQFYLNKNKND